MSTNLGVNCRICQSFDGTKKVPLSYFKVLLIFGGMFIFKIILYPFSLFYGGLMAIRNLFFKWGIFSVEKMEVPVIAVGNLSVGGTGKTPHVAYLIEVLNLNYKTAILLRGYGRKSKGYLEVKRGDKTRLVGDEAVIYARRFAGRTKISVCENRIEGARKIVRNYPQTNIIVLDDAYQHRSIYRDCNILLTEYHRPFFKDSVLPSGRLREFPNGKHRADMVLVTKTPAEASRREKEIFQAKLKLRKNIPVYFSSIHYGEMQCLFGKNRIQKPKNILLITGIGNPKPLLNYFLSFSEVKHLNFKDHHAYTIENIQRIHKLFDKFAEKDKVIVTTEKDAVRLLNSDLKNEIKRYPWFFQPITVKIEKEQEFKKILNNYARQD